jgi:hypothetical protein
MIEQVLLNLARNAMQAMADTPPPRLLRLAVQPEPQPRRAALRFAVSDTGSGIGDEVASQLFTPFFTTKAEGMGLGLSLCRTAIEQHGGTLVHEPQRPRGTVFSFGLTVADAPAHAPPAAPDEGQRRACRLGRAAQHADEVAGVVQVAGATARSWPLHEGVGVVLGQEADEAPRQDQRGDRLLVERGGAALQVAGVRQLHVGRVVAQAGEVRTGRSAFQSSAACS